MPLNYMETGSLLLSMVSVNRLYFFDRLRSACCVCNRHFVIKSGVYITHSLR